MSDIHGTVYVSASGDDSTQATVNPVFKTMTKAVSVNPDKIIVLDGEYPAADPMVFNGIPIEIRNGNITTGLYCGRLYDSGANGTEHVSGSPDSPEDINVTIQGGNLTKIIAFGDRAHIGDPISRYGNTDVLITGGTFQNGIGCPCYTYTGADKVALNLYGNTRIRVKGGTFISNNNKCWIYGGVVATNMGAASYATVYGDTHVVLDSSDNPVTITSTAANYGSGNTQGNHEVMITGSHNITVDRIYGGNYGDDADENTGAITSTIRVSGNRTLTFSGFKATLNANWIQGFTHIAFKDGCDATLTNTAITLISTGNWMFEAGSKLTANFSNDFTGDTLNLVSFPVGKHTLITAPDSSAVFTGFGALGEIQIDGSSVSATYNSQTRTYSLPGGATLGLVSANGNTSLVYNNSVRDGHSTKTVKLKSGENYVFSVTQLANITVTAGPGIDVSGNSISCTAAVAGNDGTAEAGVVRPDSTFFVVDGTGFMTMKRASTTRAGVARFNGDYFTVDSGIVAPKIASTSQIGVAKFNSSHFTVSNGNVSAKSGTTSNAGILQLATTTEATTGTNTSKAVTPAGLAAAIANASSGSSGSSGATELNGLSDVQNSDTIMNPYSNPTDNFILVYNPSTKKWQPSNWLNRLFNHLGSAMGSIGTPFDSNDIS